MEIAAIDRLPRRDSVPDQQPVRCVTIEKSGVVSPGVVFEPIKGDKQGFTYGVFKTAFGNDEQVVVTFHGYRVVLRGARMGALTDDFSFQRVRYIRQVGSAEKALAGIGESRDPVITDILIEEVHEH
jgi:hypothetical protein